MTSADLPELPEDAVAAAAGAISDVQLARAALEAAWPVLTAAERAATGRRITGAAELYRRHYQAEAELIAERDGVSEMTAAEIGADPAAFSRQHQMFLQGQAAAMGLIIAWIKEHEETGPQHD